MTIPGPVIVERDAPTPRTAETNTGVWFVALPAERGPVEPTSITSPDAYAAKFGGAVSYSIAPDVVEAFFREGGQKIVFARVVGPAATVASKVLKDGAAADTLKVEGIGPDVYSNSLKVAVVAGSGSTFVLVISTTADGELERSPELADVAAAVAWGSTSSYVRVTSVGSGTAPAVAAAASLTTGKGDEANLTDQSFRDALAKLASDLGPGQVSIPGRVTGTAYADLVAHANANNRIAYLDVDTADTTKTTLKAKGVAARAIVGSDKAAVFGPWAQIPGSVPGTIREVPYSAIAAAQAARVDAQGNPNVPAAGDNGVSRVAFAVKGAALTDAERGELNDAGVNVARVLGGRVVTFGFRTAADPLKSPLRWQLANVRLDMAVAAQANAIAGRYVFRQLDADTIGDYGADLAAMLSGFFVKRALYGATPDEAYLVDVGATVNTPESIAAGELRAVLAIKRSPMAERAIVEVVRVALGQAL